MPCVRNPFFVLILLVGCTHPSVPQASPSLTSRIDTALAASARYLGEHQSTDGAWRSTVYGSFKEGDALTPLVLTALHSMREKGETYRRGSQYLAAMCRDDGSIDTGPHGLTFSVYTAAFAVIVLDRDDQRAARTAWLKYLRQQQLTEDLGWQPDDREYGGWGYCAVSPKKPQAGADRPPLLESNLSATAMALDALHAAGVAANDASYRKARVFVERCQNFSDKGDERDPGFDDGGFYFIYADPVRNKAGSKGTDKHGQERFASYGSTTADGLRSLLRCGLPIDHPRVKAASAWLLNDFRADQHPGMYPKDREASRAGVYFYYLQSLARTLPALPGDQRATARSLAEALVKLQRPDGSWLNAVGPQREDDPVVATSYAILALAACRDVIGTTVE
jgi:hypothetical protein